MKLALMLGPGGASDPASTLAVVREAERLGYSQVWAAEAYGYDSVSILAWLAGQTSRISLGSAVLQIPGRTPAMTAMTAASLQALSAGRFRLGLGVSGPQVSEGWHGVAFGSPLARTREYLEVVRLALSGRELAHEGKFFPLPLEGSKAIRSSVKVADQPPIYLAAVGPKNLRLAGRMADGWLGIFFSPEQAELSLAPIRAGRAEAGLDLAGFDVVPTVPVALGPDPHACADLMRGYTALYVGGMGSREQNFYNALARRLGFEQEAEKIQDLYLAKQHREAAAAVPEELVRQTSLIGPDEQVVERLRAYADAGVTTLAISLFNSTTAGKMNDLRKLPGLLELAGVA